MKKIVLTLLLLAFCSSAFAGEELVLYNWSSYMPAEVLEQFTKETGIKVTEVTYDSNEAMYAKIKMVSDHGYDLIVPSTDFVIRMREQGLLHKLDKKLLPNMKNLNPRFVGQDFDKNNDYSVPYFWGSSGIAVNADFVSVDEVSSIKDLLNPELKGRILLLNDVRGVFAIALKANGYSVNDRDPEHIKQAFEFLKKLLPSVKVFDSDSPKQAMLSNEVLVGQLWNGEAFVANSENEAIQYVYPKEGYSLWMDHFCIPRGARHVENAHKFINFILRPDISAEIAEELGYSSPNAEAVKLLPENIRNNPICYPDDETLSRGEFEVGLGDATKIYEQYWMKLKTGAQ
ncbi:extracellular solute-binding protein [Maridesulfovibrio bastinii]|uniref:extracellular solute-binding protein n=1 Tax=Maridesulfovibrio bastinii TaxID=47157 RepID=UPI000423E02A|nr:extracellular solute-binding protein [Maridesulfovibrio bastinii]